MRKLIKIIPFLMVIFLVSLSSACANDTDVNNMTDSDVLTSTDDDMAISTANNEEIVKSINVSSKTFSDLSKEINKTANMTQALPLRESQSENKSQSMEMATT